jgi:hypothetical protein
MDEPMITFGTESLILEMFPQPNPAEKSEDFPELIPNPEHVVIEMEPVPKKSWCSIS